MISHFSNKKWCAIYIYNVKGIRVLYNEEGVIIILFNTNTDKIFIFRDIGSIVTMMAKNIRTTGKNHAQSLK